MGGQGGQRRGLVVAAGGEESKRGIRDTSHVTRHTSHITRHTSHVTCFMLVRSGDFIPTVAELSFCELMVQGLGFKKSRGLGFNSAEIEATVKMAWGGDLK